MKLYYASTAPGTEGDHRVCPTPHRLLSFVHIVGKKFDAHKVFRQLLKGDPPWKWTGKC